ncbi:MAG: indolepyruvate ferredoxin oxidoreductase subunit alpha [Oscillospiraceae bacterium]|jgi:indolepyruvate ferredoxin oxidoreductase alpha subunit|nr:indolepyruvate ferredoxin oxidoreductase subunit alpha [Oscillospiraceae bacterium]
MPDVRLLLGNEAVARGAWEAGCRVVASYPGTPSTEITESCARYPDLDTEWSVNEKVAMEIAAGASIGGARTLTCMKHVGLNVAADPLFTLAYTGVNAGLVVVVADDPGVHSSQNEQDSRYYARSAHLPMLVPSDASECLSFTKLAFDLSEQYDTPVIIGVCTRVAHARSRVELGERVEHPSREWTRNPSKYVMLPGPARARHIVLERRENCLRAAAETADWAYTAEYNDKSVGVICAGAAYQYVKEAMPNASVFKLNMVYPLPDEAIRGFAANVEQLLVVEELEPFIEDAVKAMGINCSGKDRTGKQGELSVNKVRAAFEPFASPPSRSAPDTLDAPEPPARPPAMCVGCPHRAVFYALARRKYTVSGDIGCYTLGMLPPHGAMDACLCMGASIGMAFGLNKARGDDFARNTVAVIGDSTFMHSGMTALLDAVYNRASLTLLILDNRITGMTGHQHNPASGFDIHNNPAPSVDLEAICRALGVTRVRSLDPFELTKLDGALKEETAFDGVSVIIARRPCALLGRKRSPSVTIEDCRKCGACMRLGCPALSKGEDGSVSVDPAQCVGCGLCARVCPFHAIHDKNPAASPAGEPATAVKGETRV